MKFIYSILFIVSFSLSSEDFYRLGLGSCHDQDMEIPAWESLKKENLDSFFFLGDNVYGDIPSGELGRLINAYDTFKQNKPQWFNEVEIFTIWDDHDYGINDGGKNWKYKNIAKKLFLDFFSVDNDDVRFKREGIYHSKDFELFNKKIKIVSLDTRFFKDDFTFNKDRSLNKKYIIDYDKNKTILGKEQWQWLSNELNKKYNLFILLSSFQVLSTSHGWEKWNNFYYERNKLLKLLNQNSLSIILSGDRHFAGIYNYKNIYEITASSFNQKTFNIIENDNLRVGELIGKNNFGIIKLDESNIEIKIVASEGTTKEVLNSIKLKY